MPDLVSTLDDRGDMSDPPRPGPLGRLAGLAYRRRGSFLIGWAIALAAAIGLSAAVGGEFATDNSVPGSDSRQAQHLLEERFPAQAGVPVDLVARADDVTGADVQGEVDALLGELGSMPYVTTVEDPYATEGAIASDGRTVVARMYLDHANANDVPVEYTQQLLATAAAAERDGLEISLGGRAVQLAEETEAGSEMIGLAAAAVILLIMSDPWWRPGCRWRWRSPDSRSAPA